MSTVIHADGLGKRYQLGQREAYGALRDSIARAFRSPLNWPWRRGRRSTGADTIWALKDVSFEIRDGEVIGIIGRNGSGKSTLLKILSRITEPTTGRAVVKGRVGSLLEVGTGFHPELTGRENVFVNGAILGMKRGEIRRKFDEIVAFAGVDRFIDTPVKFYSSGMQVRLAFAVAAHLEPNILIVDEVLAVGDMEFQRRCLGKMKDVSEEGRTVILVSHQLNQIRRLCGRAVWLDQGSIKQTGDVGDIIRDYEHAVMDETDTPASGGCFVKWEIVDSGHVLRSSETAFTIRTHISLAQAVSQGHYGLALLDDRDAVVTGWAFEPVSLLPGRHWLDVRVPQFPVRPGSYRMLFALFDGGNNLTGGTLLERWVASPPLTVAVQPVAHPQDDWAGILNLPATLAQSRVAELAEAPREVREPATTT